MAAYDTIAIYCELMASRMPLIESQKYCFLLQILPCLNMSGFYCWVNKHFYTKRERCIEISNIFTLCFWLINLVHQK